MDDVLIRLLDELPLGVVLLDRKGGVVHFNKAEERLAHRSLQSVRGVSFFEEVAPCMNVRELSGAFFEGIGKRPLSARIEFSFPFPWLEKSRDVIVQLSSFQQRGEDFGCLIVEDVSAQRSLQRLQGTLGSLLVHDLKSPLTATMANLEFVGSSPALAAHPILIEAITDAQRSSRRLQQMIVDLLDVTALENGKLKLSRTTIDLADLVATVAEDVKPVAREREVTVRVQRSAGAVPIFADRSLVRRALDNLTENALRYTPRGRSVTLSARAIAGGAQLTVADEGPGIPEGLRDRVFEKYVQAESAGAAGMNRGLGLTMVKLVALAHGGSARVQCPSSGGTVFELTLADKPDVVALEPVG